MTDTQSHTRRKSPSSAKRDEAIDALLAEHAPSEHQDLLSQMMITVCRLAKDGAGRGEIKILNTALKELRYAILVPRKTTSPRSQVVHPPGRRPT